MTMTLGQRLGQQLRQQEADRAATVERKRRAEELAETRRIAAERDKVRSIFESARNDVLEAVADARQPKGVVVKGYGMPFLARGPRGLSDLTPVDPGHPYHDIYVEFAAWAASEGVQFRINYQHDGMGMHSWHRVTVVPL
jgi:hypothetical protein